MDGTVARKGALINIEECQSSKVKVISRRFCSLDIKTPRRVCSFLYTGFDTLYTMPLVMLDPESYTIHYEPNLDMRVLHDISSTLTGLCSAAGNHVSLRLAITTTMTKS